MRILALSLDLDDTLWPVTPAIEGAERALDLWLRTHHAPVAARWPIAAMRELRDRVAAAHPHLAHDFSAQRRITLRQAFASCDLHDQDHDQQAYEVYFAARNRVDCYPDVVPALSRLAAQWPLVSVSNGNADLGRIGLAHHFVHTVAAREVGVAKPHPAIFHHACARLGIAPEHVLHIGDDLALDVAGARAAGLRSAWINRHAQPRNGDVEPDLEFCDLAELAAWLAAHRAESDAEAAPRA